MKITDSKLPGVKIIEPSVFGDHRGWFMETHNYNKLKEEGIDINFIQDNQSYSAEKGTLRGLHYQLEPKAQAKLIRCTKGAIFDVAVDIRKGSPTYGKWFGLELSAENKKQLLVPRGFAHGFITITEDVEVQYKVDNDYAPNSEGGIIWNDTTIGIEWPTNIEPILSDKDKVALTIEKAENNFVYEE
ncbi:dTDP-4-dehydrorhamnose 3,5-epimerase [Virgibacillus halodenitrificans]|uniref:dTDP-4-dehydrorhamnose 3,5-epimerase n=1 Tax=Virgibacillus halodenitrificans TaxID=1482 RepID=A0ABR7VKV4_VIRHA|nr:dTDP-4-dehydrorhamnose 3,5-epimerase [Virgibacillus halodenitrificans]MBD1221403.1 dTDP-4-dehydrorhamnose 3,5-epimerase [Virgibacillus halodenitrificans]